MLHPWQPHMHVCLLDASALVGRLTSSNRQTHTRANLSVRAGPLPPPHSNRVCASKGVGAGRRAGGRVGSDGQGRGGGGERGRDRAGWEEVRGSGGTGGRPLVHPLRFRAFPNFLELSKESLSPASQLRSSSVQLCQSLYVQYMYLYIYIYKYISISVSISVKTRFAGN